MSKIYRSYREMTEEEQKATGLPTDYESMKSGSAPVSVVLGYDPFLVKVDKTWEQLTEEEKEIIRSRN